MFTWSENPINDLWNHIRFFGKRVNCKRLLLGEIDSGRKIHYTEGPDLDKKVNQISMCINQASEYFTAAHQVSINTSPLLLFYGMLSLAKALIVANKRDIFLEDIKYHGLYTRPIDDELLKYRDNPKNWTMEQEYAITNDGVFKHFTEIVDKFTFENGSIIKFKNILSICPEISAMYEKYYDEASKTLPLYSFKKISDEPIKIMLAFNVKNENEVYIRFPEFRNDFDLAPDLLHEQARQFISKDLSDYPNYIDRFQPVVGGDYVVGYLEYDVNNTNKKHVINQALADYIAMYILSLCVRYKQDFWGSVVNGEKTGILGLIELYISVIKRRYPNIILDLLVGEKFRYGSPAYLGGPLLKF